MITETHHFLNLPSAIRYYRPYGFTELDVRAKIDAGEIALGPPTFGPEQRVYTVSGRYHIEDVDRRISLCRIRLNAGGYTSRGVYFGVGMPLFYFISADDEVMGHIRAVDRADAIAQIRHRYPDRPLMRGF